MSLSHGSATRTALCEAAVRRIDGGSGAGLLRFLDASNNILCAITLQDPAFGSPSGAQQSLLGVPLQGNVTMGGTVSQFRFVDSDGTVVIQGSVAVSGGDINLTSLAWDSGNIIQIDGFAYIAAT